MSFLLYEGLYDVAKAFSE